MSSSSCWRRRGGCRDTAGVISKVGRAHESVHGERARGARRHRRHRRRRPLTSKTPRRSDECGARGGPGGSATQEQSPPPAFMCATERRHFLNGLRLRPPTPVPSPHTQSHLNTPSLPPSVRHRLVADAFHLGRTGCFSHALLPLLSFCMTPPPLSTVSVNTCTASCTGV